MSETNDRDGYNKGGLIAFVFSMVFSISFFIWISFIHPGVDLKEIKEMGGEDTTNLAAQSETKSYDVSNVQDPWMSSEDMIGHGKSVYKTNCAICHGDSGKGDGPAGQALVPPPRNIVEGNWKVGGDRISLHRTFTKGIEGTSMAAFGHLSKVDRWSLVHYVRSITENLVKDDDAKTEAYAKSAE